MKWTSLACKFKHISYLKLEQSLLSIYTHNASIPGGLVRTQKEVRIVSDLLILKDGIYHFHIITSASCWTIWEIFLVSSIDVSFIVSLAFCWRTSLVVRKIKKLSRQGPSIFLAFTWVFINLNVWESPIYTIYWSTSSFLICYNS